MNKQPVYYLQTSSEWKNVDYSAPGESTTIGASGCGPTSAAMLIETLTGKTYTPVDACKWSLSHGYKAVNQGTYYSYFKPQFAAFGIDCRQLNSATVYGNPNASVHAEAFSLLKQGYYLIACMGRGLWTSSGHFVVVWWENGLVRINDPASTKTERLNGDLQTFKSQVKYYWAIDAREYNKEQIDVTEMNVTGIVTTTNTNLNVRNGPSTAYGIIGSLKSGAAVTVVGSSGEWYKIQYGGATAWVSAQYIKLLVREVSTITDNEEEDDDVDVNRFKELWLEMRKELQDNDSSEYSTEARDWAVSTGLIQGGDSNAFNGMWEDLMSREQFVTVLYRFAKMIGKA